jgi:hypothetical protein
MDSQSGEDDIGWGHPVDRLNIIDMKTGRLIISCGVSVFFSNAQSDLKGIFLELFEKEG